MPRTCRVCAHSERAAIDEALLSGEPLRNIAERVSVSVTSLFRHKRHLSQTLAKSREAAEVSRADSLMGQLSRLAEDARRIQAKAEAAKDYRGALAGVRELTRLVELAAGLSREKSISLEDARELFCGFAHLVREHVKDSATLKAIGAGFRELTERMDPRIAQVPEASLPGQIRPR